MLKMHQLLGVFQQLAFFVQDEWQVTPDLSVNGGLRYETFIQGDETPNRVDFLNDYGRTSQNNLDGNSILLPRVGFRYTPYDRTTVSGGLGLFSGSAPKVWVSNAYQPQIFSAFGLKFDEP